MNRTTAATIAAAFDQAAWSVRFPTQAARPETCAAYARVLCDLPAELVTAACLQLAATDDGFPSPARIRRTCALLAGVQLPTWEQAWAEAVQLARWHRDLDLGNQADQPPVQPLTARIYGLVGGWREILGDHPATVRAHFRDLHTAHAEPTLRRALALGGDLAHRAAELAAGTLPELGQ